MKIYIVGSVGSGKTTLARQVAANLHIPHFETDNFVWNHKPTGDNRNEIEVRNQLFNDAVKLEEWVIEGVHIDWTDKALLAANEIVFLDIPVNKRTWRIIGRYIRQILKIEKVNYKPTFTIFRKMFGWNTYFEEQMKPLFLEKFEVYGVKVHCLHTNEDVENWLQQLSVEEAAG
ncbi:AAA family ATPase [Psychrobacillus antarcticus]|uniref:AAA family ATPase n=1 Tax=Psychrobacillus antarcticus TaxID=2879115 RepID=UPI002407BA6D|nr:AAA family ATPase [Psychrobacillus antarcticus]